MDSLTLSIGLISFLNRREELAVPSWPAESIRTCTLVLACPVVTPRIWPIKQLPFRFAPGRPIAITLLAVVMLLPALAPKAVLPMPVMLLPLVLLESALVPMAVLNPPVVLP